MKVANNKLDAICKDSQGSEHNLYAYDYNEFGNTIDVETQIYNTAKSKRFISFWLLIHFNNKKTIFKEVILKNYKKLNQKLKKKKELNLILKKKLKKEKELNLILKN